MSLSQLTEVWILVMQVIYMFSAHRQLDMMRRFLATEKDQCAVPQSMAATRGWPASRGWALL